MKVLITGITGFAGSHLADYILKHYPDVEIFGTRHWRSRLDNVEHFIDRVTLIECDLKDQASTIQMINIVEPDRIFHLAAHSYVPTSWNMPNEVMANNVGGEISLLEAVRTILPKKSVRIQLACSSEEYGIVKQNETPITENNPLRPASPYGVSKVAQDLLGAQYWQSYQMHIIRTRAFNHTGPRRGEVFVCSDFAKQLVEIELGLREPVIKVGNLAAIRDFTDVRDMVRAYWLALEKGQAGEVYNIGGGKVCSMRDILDLLLQIAGLVSKVKVVMDFNRLRPSDVPILVCDCSKFQKRTGWAPTYSFNTTMTDLLNYWRLWFEQKLPMASRQIH